jgi:hypothetical protein
MALKPFRNDDPELGEIFFHPSMTVASVPDAERENMAMRGCSNRKFSARAKP